MKTFNKKFIFGMLLLCCMQVHAQDTIHISLPEAEKQFTQQNLSLLAEKYNIDISKAQIIQAKLYSNPNLSVVGNIYNPQQKKALDISDKTGEYIISAQQLIRLAGKRNKEIKLAETATQLSENKFFDLMRTLRFSLSSNFYELYYLQQTGSIYQKQISSLEKMDTAYQQLQAKGVVTLKDAVRIRSLLYSLRIEQTSLQNQVNDLQAEMQLLLHNNKAYFIAESTNAEDPVALLKRINLQSLIDTAYINRYDLKLAETNIAYNEQNYKLQKALATPDLTAGAQFDKRGSFVDNASFFTLAMDLPFFHRNQGNIRAAKISIDQSKVVLTQERATVENEVQRAYQKALTSDKLLQSIDPGFNDQFNKLLQGITENFLKKNISLIEFVDFFDSYKDNVLQFNHLQNDRMQAIEALEFAIGKNLFTN